MAKYIVKKSGPLRGEVQISGAKNAVLPLMAAALLCDEECVIKDVPALRDVEVMREILEELGSKIVSLEDNVLSINTVDIISTEPSYNLVNQMRASILVMGPLLARKGIARIPLPGGCAIGARPIDLHLKGFEALGAEIVIKEDEGYIEAVAGPQGMIGETIYFDFPSVGATENVMMAAVLAEGTTYIENAAKEPEIVDLAIFETSEEAVKYIDEKIDGCTVGIGGSVTIRDIGLSPLLEKHNTVYWHWNSYENLTQEEILKKAMNAEVYLSSVNGLAETGEIINIDGTCNRISAICYGHKKVYFIAGRNKIEPDFERALSRARNIAAPLNARRLSKKTPCAVGELRCYDCNSKERICRGLSVFWEKPKACDFEVVLINEDLGY